MRAGQVMELWRLHTAGQAGSLRLGERDVPLSPEVLGMAYELAQRFEDHGTTAPEAATMRDAFDIAAVGLPMFKIAWTP